MRRTAQLYKIISLSIVLSTAPSFAFPDNLSPFTDPFYDLIPQEQNHGALIKRQGCPGGYNDCSALGAGGVCCPSNTNCAIDQANNVACCPFNALCTGFISGTLSGTITQTSTATSSAGSNGLVLGGTTTITPTTTTATTTFQTGVTQVTGVAGGGSTVPNIYYPFVYIPTSYANAALCSNAWTSCQMQSTACFGSLAGTFGVTVSGIAGGTTQAGATATGIIASSASSICSSLSVSACYNLQVTQCNALGGSGSVQSAAGPRQTACPGMIYAAGAVFGAVGVML